MFGHSDIALHRNTLEDQIERVLNQEAERNKDQLLPFTRVFTIRATQYTEVLVLSIKHLNTMRLEFPMDWLDFLINAYERFSLESKIKLQAIHICEQAYSSKDSTKKRRTKFEAYKMFTSQNKEHESTKP